VRTLNHGGWSWVSAAVQLCCASTGEARLRVYILPRSPTVQTPARFSL
jgi:hypothetical protein